MHRKLFLTIVSCLTLLTLLLSTEAIGSLRTSVFYGLSERQAGLSVREMAQHNRRQQRDQKALTSLSATHQNPPGGAGGSPSNRTWFSLLVSLVMLSGGLMAVTLLLRYMLQQAGLTWSHAYSSVAVVIIVGVAAIVANSIWPTASQRGKVAAQQGESSSSRADQFSAAFAFGGNDTTQIGGADYDANGNLYVAGGFIGSLEVTINGQAVTLTGTNDYDVFVAKFDANQNCLWVRKAEGATNLREGYSLDGALALAVDAQGNCYLGGGFVKTLAFKDANGATVASLQDDNEDINFESFLAKYDTNGNLAWAKGGNSGSADDPETNEDLDQGINGITEISVDQAGNPFVAGTATGLRFLGTNINNHGASDTIVARVNPTNGDVVWAQLAGGKLADGALGLALDNASNVYVIGYFDDVATFPTTPVTSLDSLGYEDTFVTKFNANGQCQWVKQIGGENDVIGSSIAVNANGDLYLTGFYLDEAQFGTTVIDSPDYVSGFLVKWDANCQYQWVRSFGQTADTSGDRIALDSRGNPFVLGVFYADAGANTALFGAEKPNEQVSLLTKDQDMYLVKYDASGAFRWARGVYATGRAGVVDFSSDEVPVGAVPLRILKHRATGAMSLFGDFKGTLSLSDGGNLMGDLTSPNARKGFAANLTHNCLPLAFSALPNARVNEAYNAKINLISGDNPASFGVESTTSLPPGLSSAADGTLSGTPTKPGVYTVKVNGTDAYDCNGSNTYQITVSTYEADVAPRSDGNGAISVADWTQIGRFIVGLDTINANEFQRVDTAPRITQGDGKLTIGDWVQAGRYAAGLDANVYAAGPTIPNLSAAFSSRAMLAPRWSFQSSRVIRAMQASDEPNTAVIELDAMGDENAFGLSFAFDPTVIRFVNASVESGLANGSLLINDRGATQGSIGLLASLPAGQRLNAGTRRLLKLRFEPVSSRATALLRFTDAATADATANALATTSANVELTLQSRMTRSDRGSGGGRRTTTRSTGR